jgi:integrase
MAYLRLPPQAYDRLLDKDPKIIQMDICDYIIHLKKSGIVASRTIQAYLAALHKFYVMNDVNQLNWVKIHSFLGENEKQTEDRPYTHSEIQMLLQKTTLRNRAIILLICSAGLRVGAVSSLRIRDIEPIDKYQLYKVNVYATSKKSRYFSFCTPECRKEIDSYLDWRKRWGERLQDDSPLFRREFNSQAEHDRGKVLPFQTGNIRWFVARLLIDTGIRPVIPLTESTQSNRRIHHRSHIMQCHGFRKFFETNAFKAGMNNMFIRRLLGQKAGLEDSYLKLSEEDLLEGSNRHTGYVDIIDQLTIDESNKLRREVEILRMDKSKLDSALSRIDDLYQKLGLT